MQSVQPAPVTRSLWDTRYLVAEYFSSCQGEGNAIGTPAFFIRLMFCDVGCKWCLVPETPVLMSDFSWKNLGEIEVGDEVCGYAWEDDGQDNIVERGLRPAKVLNVLRRRVPLNSIEFENGAKLVGTEDHKLFDTTWRNRWKGLGKFKVGQLVKTLAPAQPSANVHHPNYLRGWISGYCIGDGSFFNQKRLDGGLQHKFKAVSIDVSLIAALIARAGEFGYTIRRVRYTGGIDKKEKAAGEITRSEEAQRFKELVYDSNVEFTKEYVAGFLAGIWDSEGSLDDQWTLKISQIKETSPLKYALIKDVIERAPFEFALEGERGWRLLGGCKEVIRFFSYSRPILTRKAQKIWGFKKLPSTAVKATGSSVAEGEVVNLTTETGTFIADGVIVRNCDSKFAWPREGKGSKEYTALELYELWRENGRHSLVVISGGEPLHHDLLPLLLVFETNAGEDIEFEIETSCVVQPSFRLIEYVLSDSGGLKQFNCSPKLSGSGAKLLQQSQDGIPNFPRSNSIWKFVCDHERDVKEAMELVERYALPKDDVYLMPQALRQEELQERSLWLIERCKELNVNFSTRLHLQLWGAKRGV